MAREPEFATDLTVAGEAASGHHEQNANVHRTAFPSTIETWELTKNSTA
jgi:hypothetical protein